MQVELSEQARQTLESLVSGGAYGSASDALEAAVTLLAESQAAYQERVEEMLEAGRRDIREGRSFLLTPQSAEALKRRVVEAGFARRTANRER